jgi:hypothetical protein
MGNPNGCRVVLLLTPPLFLLFPVGVLIFALERISKALILEQTQRDWRSGSYKITVYGPTSTGSNNLTYTDVTFHTNEAPTLAILGICCLSFIVSAIGVFGIWELRKVEGTAGHQRKWAWTMLLSNVVMVGASAGVLGYASSVQSSERSWPKYEDVGKDEQRFTRETWACQIDKFYPDESWAKAACGTAKATRFLLIPMAVSSAIVLVSLWVLVRDRGGLKWLGGGKGRYGGFKSVYELQPTVSSAPYAFQAAPQGTPQPFQQWPQQPHHQWAPQPYQQWPQQPYQQWPQQPYQQAPQQPDSQPSQQPASHDQAPDIKTSQQVVFR